MSTSRSASYVPAEDILLCKVYVDISQNPIIGINQSRDQFWSRIVTEYNGSKNALLQERNRRSLQCRMTTIIKAMGKLRGCIRQIENLNRSGASEIDIYDQAKTLLYQDPEFAKGFKFDHVWEQMKNIEKFAPNHGDSSSHVNSQAPETPVSSSSSGMPSFSINLSDDGSPTPTSSQRPIGIKKAKLKRKQSEDSTTQFDVLKRQSDELLEVMKQKAEREKQKAEFKQSREERKIMMIDINTISDPVARAFIESERAKIMQKRADQQNFQASNNMDGFGSLYQNIGPSGNDLSDY